MPRPLASEHAPYFGTYISLVTAEDIVPCLIRQTADLLPFWRSFSEQQSNQAPAGKWSIKEVLQHISDTERIFAYRALRIGRGDSTPLPGFEQDGYVENSGAARRSWASLVDEYETVRRASLFLFESFPADAWQRQGTASNGTLSARAAAYIVAGHELHHVAILRRDYL